MTEIEIRDAVPADIPALHRLIESAYRGEASRAGWTTEADLLEGQRTDPEGLADILADPAQGLLTAWRGGGLGRRLVEAAHRALAERFGARRVRISVFPQRETLIAWYERLGYRKTGETLPFPYGDLRFGLPKRDDLYFVVMEHELG